MNYRICRNKQLVGNSQERSWKRVVYEVFALDELLVRGVAEEDLFGLHPWLQQLQQLPLFQILCADRRASATLLENKVCHI